MNLVHGPKAVTSLPVYLKASIVSIGTQYLINIIKISVPNKQIMHLGTLNDLISSFVDVPNLKKASLGTHKRITYLISTQFYIFFSLKTAHPSRKHLGLPHL